MMMTRLSKTTGLLYFAVMRETVNTRRVNQDRSAVTAGTVLTLDLFLPTPRSQNRQPEGVVPRESCVQHISKPCISCDWCERGSSRPPHRPGGEKETRAWSVRRTEHHKNSISSLSIARHQPTFADQHAER